MKRVLFVALSVVALSCSQTKQRPGWPSDKPEVDTLKLREGVVPVTRAVANKARVKKDQLRFPVSMAGDVMNDWPVGKVVVGQEAEDMADRANNPFGFMRKVKAVNIVADEVVIETENALLDDVLEGQFHKQLDFSNLEPVVLPEGTDLSAYDVVLNTDMGNDFPLFPKPGEQPLRNAKSTTSDGSKQTLQGLFATGRRTDALKAGTKLSVSETARNILSFSNKTFTPQGRPDLEVKVSGSLDFTPIVDLNPNIVIDFDFSLLKARLEEFEFSAGLDGKLGARVETTLSVVPKNPNISAADYTEALRQFGLVGLKYPIPQVPLAQASVKGSLGPIPITVRASAFLECTDAYFKGSAKLKTQASMGLSPRAGIHYTHKNGWEPVLDFPFKDPSYSMEVIGNSAALQMDCGMYVRVDILAAGVAGPYAQVRRSMVIDAKREEVCNNNAQKDHQATEHSQVDVRMYDALQVGAEIDLIVASIEKGPYDLARREYKTVEGDLVPNPRYIPGVWWFGPEMIRSTKWEPIWSWSKDRANVGATRCEVPCDDQAKSAGETDVDCGGSTCAKCKKGKACTVATDCASNTCLTGGTCQGVPCDDDAKGEQETDIDCGGPSCSKCTAGKGCLADSDCQSGVCGGNGRCVASLCEDGIKNAQETDVDCGGPICRACAIDKVCVADGDCEQGFCSKDTVTPHTCTENVCRDNKVSGTEGDVDCGASVGCTRLCALAQGCNSDADCQSGACNLVTHACVANKCADARQDEGETDVDCGGPCPVKCAVGGGCNYAARGNGDCQSGQCASNNVCVATACQNLRVDVTEVGTDCSGSCAARCPYNETCNVTGDCSNGLICHPLRRKCQLPGCDDGLLNGQESAIDCGGPTCSKCAVSKTCNQGSDCVTGQCFNGRCISGPCENQVKDATEADVDCGGSCGALKCGLNKSCTANSDCASNICAAGKCISDPCFDLVRNAAETDVDCGGSACAARCQPGKSCVSGADCASGQCNMMTLKCAASACEDGVKNGTETDVDCGGSCSAKCAVNKVCAFDVDCQSSVCNATTGRCVPDRCSDGVKNGTETAVDCGGSCESKCGFDVACATNLDCQSGSCTVMGRCASDQCSDGRVNGSESAIDCGGTCATKCALGQSCASGTDCVNPQNLVGVAGYCAVGSQTCVSSSCNTGIKDGDETDADCGGSCATKCAVGKACTGNGDCASTICHITRHTCSATQRDDGIKNGDETDIDCGGSAPTGCAVGKGCAEPWDCTSGYCSAAGLCLPSIPQTCNDVPIAQRSGSGGLFTIDPDGPRKKRSAVSDVPGYQRPITTWCYFPSNEYQLGWTPIFYLNSENSTIAQFNNSYTGAIPNTSGFAPLRYCNNNAECAVQNPNDRCHDVRNGGICTTNTGECYCMSDEVWSDSLNPPGLRQHPSNLSVSQAAQRDRAMFQYEIASATSGRGMAHPAAFPTRPQYFRWTAYRNGAQVFDSHYFTSYDLADNWQKAWIQTHNYTLAAGPYSRAADSRSSSEDLNWLWCGDHSLPFYPTVTAPNLWWRDTGGNTAPQLGIPPAPYSQALNGGSNIPLLERCYSLPKSPVGRDTTTVNIIYGLMRERPRATSSGSVGYTGLWWGRYGVSTTGQGTLPWFFSYEAPPTGQYMGFCNGMTSGPSTTWADSTLLTAQGTPCQAYHHVTGQSFQWYANEQTSNPAYGSVFQAGVPGLVFVLWAN